MASPPNLFTVADTHGILRRPENQVHAASDRLGWSALYASTQSETPYESNYSALPDHLLIMHLDGRVGVSQILGATTISRRVLPGGFFMLPGGMDFGVRLHGRLETVHVYVRQRIVEEVAADLCTGDPAALALIPRLGDHDPLLEQLASEVRELILEAEPSMPAYADYLARGLAARLVRAHSTRAANALSSSRLAAGGLSRRQYDRTMEFLTTHLDQRLDLEQIASASALSPVHFARRFKQTTGMAPHQHLTAMRIERAKHLLAATSVDIAEIAIECGFAHQQHLTRVFRKLTASTPAAFRRARRL
jgi:AraC family transcriptional regulator